MTSGQIDDATSCKLSGVEKLTTMLQDVRRHLEANDPEYLFSLMAVSRAALEQASAAISDGTIDRMVGMSNTQKKPTSVN